MVETRAVTVFKLLISFEHVPITQTYFRVRSFWLTNITKNVFEDVCLYIAVTNYRWEEGIFRSSRESSVVEWTKSLTELSNSDFKGLCCVTRVQYQRL